MTHFLFTFEHPSCTEVYF